MVFSIQKFNEMNPTVYKIENYVTEIGSNNYF